MVLHLPRKVPLISSFKGSFVKSIKMLRSNGPCYDNDDNYDNNDNNDSSYYHNYHFYHYYHRMVISGFLL